MITGLPILQWTENTDMDNTEKDEEENFWTVTREEDALFDKNDEDSRKQVCLFHNKSSLGFLISQDRDRTYTILASI